MSEVKLIIMSGLPGSGKSTYAAKLAKKEHAWIVSADEIRKYLYGDASRNDEPNKIFAKVFYSIHKGLSRKKSVIVDCVSVTAASRKKYLRKYEGEYDKSVCVYMDTPVEICKSRNSKRDRVVPDDAIDKFAERMEIPTKDEGFDEIIVMTPYGKERK